MVLWSIRTLIWNRGYFSRPLSPSECADGLNSIWSERLLAFQVKDVSMQSCCFQRLSWFRCEALNASICVYMLHHSGSVSELQGIKSAPIWIHSTNIHAFPTQQHAPFRISLVSEDPLRCVTSTYGGVLLVGCLCVSHWYMSWFGNPSYGNHVWAHAKMNYWRT